MQVKQRHQASGHPTQPWAVRLAGPAWTRSWDEEDLPSFLLPPSPGQPTGCPASEPAFAQGCPALVGLQWQGPFQEGGGG